MGLFRRNKTATLERVANAPVGSRVMLGDASGVITGTMVFEAAGDRWVEHLLTMDTGHRVWVSVENFDTTVATQWTVADPMRVEGGPDDRRVNHDNVSYKRSEAGMASFTSIGDTGVDENGSVDYVDFEAADGRRLGFERFGEIGARRRSIATAGNCPNCGAALQVDAQGRCRTCGARATVDEGQWDEWECSAGIDVSAIFRLA